MKLGQKERILPNNSEDLDNLFHFEEKLLPSVGYGRHVRSTPASLLPCSVVIQLMVIPIFWRSHAFCHIGAKLHVMQINRNRTYKEK